MFPVWDPTPLRAVLDAEQTATLNVPRGEYVLKLSVKRVDSPPFMQVERSAIVNRTTGHNPPVTRLVVSDPVMDDLRVSQPSGQANPSTTIFGCLC